MNNFSMGFVFFVAVFISSPVLADPPPLSAAFIDVAMKKTQDKEEILRDCAGHYFSRSYTNFFACAINLDLLIDHASGDSRYYPAIIDAMRAELELEMGRPAVALNHAIRAYEAIPVAARKWKKSSFDGKDLDEFSDFLERLKDAWAGNESLPLVPEMVEVVAKNTGLLARSYYLNGDIRRAEHLNVELALFDDAGYRERLYFSFIRNKFDGVVKMKEAKDEELRQFRSALFVSLISPDRPTYAFWENYNVAIEQYIYGKSLLELGQLEKSAVALDLLLSWKGLENFGGLYWAVLYERARLHKKQGNRDEELILLRRAVETIESIRSTISLEAGKLGFAGDKQTVYNQLVGGFADRGEWTEAIDYAERAKARALVDMLSEKIKIAAPPAADEKVLNLLAMSEKSEALVFSGRDPGIVRSARSASREELGRLAPEVASLVSVPSIPLSQVIGKLDPSETLIDYFLAGNSIYAFVVNAAGVKGFAIDSTGVEKDVRDFRKAIEASDSTAHEVGKRLHRRLLAPLLHEVRGEKLTISPHGALHYLPFVALTDGEKYLLDRFSVRIMPSASALVYLRTDKPRKAGRLLSLGNPDLGDSRYDLPGAQKEAIQVASMFPSSKALLRKEASKRAVREFGTGFSIIHIASHGEFDAKSPLNSGLLLAADGADKGRLTVADLYSLRLDAELVTLSACETGLGKLASGDDVVGLTRGFLYAGARSIVASLWKVDDDSTSVLMTNFYRYLSRNIEQREALRLAQIKTKENFPHPYYWAAFQITGAAN